MDRKSHASNEAGFTLVELLIVIVILGVLATVTVFAVRTITTDGQESSCAGDLANLETAQAMHFAMERVFADEATLVSAGVLRDDSSLHDTTGDADGYDVVPAAGSACTVSVSGGAATSGGSSPTPPAPPPPMTGSFNWHGGVDAWRYGPDADGANEIVVIGGSTGWADWNALEDAGTPSPRRTHFVDIASLNAGSLDQLLLQVDSNGDTTLVLYTPDDAQPIGGAGNVSAYLTGPVDRLAAYNGITLRAVGAGDLASVLSSTTP